MNEKMTDTGDAWRSNIVLASDLKTAKFRPPQFVVPGLIPEGLSILCWQAQGWQVVDGP